MVATAILTACRALTRSTGTIENAQTVAKVLIDSWKRLLWCDRDNDTLPAGGTSEASFQFAEVMKTAHSNRFGRAVNRKPRWKWAHLS